MSTDLQAEVQAAIDGLVESEAEIGLQVAVLHEGRLVVDAVAGVADQRTGDPSLSEKAPQRPAQDVRVRGTS